MVQNCEDMLTEKHSSMMMRDILTTNRFRGMEDGMVCEEFFFSLENLVPD